MLGVFMGEEWWTKWHWIKFFSEFIPFSFHPSIVASSPITALHPYNTRWRPIRLWYVEEPTFSRQSAHRWR
jgi:hypothetical protein